MFCQFSVTHTCLVPGRIVTIRGSTAGRIPERGHRLLKPELVRAKDAIASTMGSCKAFSKLIQLDCKPYRICGMEPWCSQNSTSGLGAGSFLDPPLEPRTSTIFDLAEYEAGRFSGTGPRTSSRAVRCGAVWFRAVELGVASQAARGGGRRGRVPIGHNWNGAAAPTDPGGGTGNRATGGDRKPPPLPPPAPRSAE